MQKLCIDAGKCGHQIVELLKTEFSRSNGISDSLLINEMDFNNNTSIIIDVKNRDYNDNKRGKFAKQLRFHIANVIADYIMYEYDQKMISKIIYENYCYFSKDERNEIKNKALEYLNENNTVISSYSKNNRKNQIISRVNEYLENNDNLIIDGFVTFRLKDYMFNLEDIVDKAVDNYLIEKEYKEFITLLSYFVEIQKPLYDEIHIYIDKNEQYILLDKYYNDVTKESINEFIDEIKTEKINYDDMLLSALITIAPLKVVIHDIEIFKTKEIFNTILNVFKKRVVLCEIKQ